VCGPVPVNFETGNMQRPTAEGVQCLIHEDSNGSGRQGRVKRLRRRIIADLEGSLSPRLPGSPPPQSRRATQGCGASCPSPDRERLKKAPRRLPNLDWAV
jgi:hypothetical protein